MPEAKSLKPEAESLESEAGRLNPRATRTSLWLPVVAYMAVIFGLSSIAHTPATPAGTDKLLHGLLYSGLGGLCARALAGGAHRVTVGVVLATVCFGALYGVSDEFHQWFNPPRNVEGLDVLADTIGSGLGAVALYAWGIIRTRDGL